MRWVAAGLLLGLLLGCAGLPRAPGGGTVEPLPALWRPPPKPDRPDLLRIEPRSSAARLGHSVTLQLRGEMGSDASCRGPGGPVSGPEIGPVSGPEIGPVSGPEIVVGSPPGPGVVDVECSSGSVTAAAQVTFTDSARLPVENPYGGGVALFKLRQLPEAPLEAVGRRILGFPSLDAKLGGLSAWALAAFPFDTTGTLDPVELRRWMLVDLRMEVNFYQAMALLRSDPAIHPQSYLPLDASFLRVREKAGWPLPFVKPNPKPAQDAPDIVLPVAHPAPAAPRIPHPGRLLEAIAAPEAWRQVTGRGVGIAIIDTGIDVNHIDVARNVRTKLDERGGEDGDGNGLPADARGANFAHLAISHGFGPPRLALGLTADVSDWDGVSEGRDSQRWGHGTAVAAAAAGLGEGGARAGVAPGAWLLPVDAQENLRIAGSLGPDRDPRRRDLPATRESRRALAPLRESAWARAAGVVYAISEGARVLTCAWPAQSAGWVLYDVLRYAEANCAIAVCAVEGATTLEGGVFPADWRQPESPSDSSGSGAVGDAWTGERTPGFFQQPLQGLVLTADPDRSPPGAPAPDLWGPRVQDGLELAVSNPRNDATPFPDRRHGRLGGPGVAAGLVAGAAALLTERRDDLEPHQIRAALIEGARPQAGRSTLSLISALEAADALPPGRCDAPAADPGGPQRARSIWDHLKTTRVRVGLPGGQTIEKGGPAADD